MSRTTTTMIFTNVEAISERYGTNLNLVNVESASANITTHLHVGADAAFTTMAYTDAHRPFVTVDIRGECNGHTSDTALFFHPETQDQLVALRDACNVALRDLRKIAKGS